MKWNLSDDRPIYLQLMDTITLAVAAGTLPPGGRLPAVRELASDAGVNPNTMQRALSELERTGLLYSQRTAGRFVTDDLTQIQTKQKELAMQQIQIFLSAMSSLGYTAEQSVDLLEQAIREGN